MVAPRLVARSSRLVPTRAGAYRRGPLSDRPSTGRAGPEDAIVPLPARDAVLVEPLAQWDRVLARRLELVSYLSHGGGPVRLDECDDPPLHVLSQCCGEEEIPDRNDVTR